MLSGTVSRSNLESPALRRSPLCKPSFGDSGVWSLGICSVSLALFQASLRVRKLPCSSTKPCSWVSSVSALRASLCFGPMSSTSPVSLFLIAVSTMGRVLSRAALISSTFLRKVSFSIADAPAGGSVGRSCSGGLLLVAGVPLPAENIFSPSLDGRPRAPPAISAAIALGSRTSCPSTALMVPPMPVMAPAPTAAFLAPSLVNICGILAILLPGPPTKPATPPVISAIGCCSA